MAMTRSDFESWLSAYGAAWEALSADAYLPLFSQDAAYHWTPFEAPKTGQAEILGALKDALSRQVKPAFRAEIITFGTDTGWASWTCSFTRKSTDDPVRIDGIMKAVFRDGVCCDFREWWHQLEPGQGDLMRDFDA